MFLRRGSCINPQQPLKIQTTTSHWVVSASAHYIWCLSLFFPAFHLCWILSLFLQGFRQPAVCVHVEYNVLEPQIGHVPV